MRSPLALPRLILAASRDLADGLFLYTLRMPGQDRGQLDLINPAKLARGSAFRSPLLGIGSSRRVMRRGRRGRAGIVQDRFAPFLCRDVTTLFLGVNQGHRQEPD